MKILGVISLIESVLRFGAVIYLGKYGIFFKQYLYLILLINIIVFAIHVHAVIKIQPSYTFCFPNRILFKEYWVYNTQSIYGDVASTSRIEGINILINSFFGPNWNAVYSLSTQIYNGLSAIQSGIVTAIKPAIIKMFSGNSIGEGLRYVNLSSYIMLAFSMLTSLIVWVNYQNIFQFWLGYVPDLLEGILYIFLIRYIINGVLQIWVIPIHASGKIWRSTLISGSIYLFSLLFAWVMFKLSLKIEEVLIMILFCSLIVGNVYLYEVKNIYDYSLFVKEEIELKKLSILVIVIGLTYSSLYLFGEYGYSLLPYISIFALALVAYIFNRYIKKSAL